MGWWRIDPQTGKPLTDGQSRLSRPPDVICLNAFPGADNDEAAHYLGDSPWNFAYSAANKIEKLLVGMPRPSEDELRRLLLDRVIPQPLMQLKAEAAANMLQAVDALWKSVDRVYKEDWQRPALSSEKRWVCEYAVRQLTEGG